MPAIPDCLFGAASLEAVVAVVNDRRAKPLDPSRVLAGPDIRRPHPDRTAEGHALSANERCRLLPARDGLVAVQLARDTDDEAVPALVEAAVRRPWVSVANFVAERSAADAVRRARLLEIPSAVLGEIGADHPVARHRAGPTGRRSRHRGSFVADLSSMWAGPLCARLVGDHLGLPVVDLESPARVDPMRSSGDSFARFLHTGRDLRELPVDAGGLDASLAEAAVVVSSGRARSLDSLGLDPDAWVARTGGLWVHVSGYGRVGPLRDAPAFGDDAAIAGGLHGEDEVGPIFLGDSAADPLTGMFGGLIAADALDRGVAGVVDMSMAGCAAFLAGNGDRSQVAGVVRT